LEREEFLVNPLTPVNVPQLALQKVADDVWNDNAS